MELETEEGTLRGRLTDLSSGGSFLELRTPLRVGSSVVLRGQIHGRLVSLRGRVAWRTTESLPSWRKTGIGIEFDEFGLKTLAALQALVDESLAPFRLAPARAQREHASTPS